MSCIVSFTYGPGAKPVVRGTQPVKLVSWDVHAWFVLLDGKKHTHSVKVPPMSAMDLVPVVGQLTDSLVDDHGEEVTSCGWTAISHGTKRKKKRR